MTVASDTTTSLAAVEQTNMATSLPKVSNRRSQDIRPSSSAESDVFPKQSSLPVGRSSSQKLLSPIEKSVSSRASLDISPSNKPHTSHSPARTSIHTFFPPDSHSSFLTESGSFAHDRLDEEDRTFLSPSSSAPHFGARSQTVSPLKHNVSRYSWMEEDDFDDEPGPGHYGNFSMFGPQKESNRASSPSPTLKGRYNNKQYISDKHKQDLLGRDTPGVGAYENDRLDAIRNKAAEIRFGSADRFAYKDKELKLKAASSPGPAGYNIDETKKPHFAFSGQTRFIDSKASSPSPAQYNVPSDFQRSRKAKSFGSSYNAYKKVYYPNVESTMRGTFTPGPGAYDPAAGSSVDIKKASSVAREPQRPGTRSITPGPGAYMLPDERWKERVSSPPHLVNRTLVGRPMASTISTHSSNPAFSFSKGKRRLDVKKMRAFSKSTWGYF
eukprot:GILK01008579.1.p1 GENE.GILK01008579.1~~GILK01008579.1.p1  ORF type:complete len:440 (-),score=59.69 GILK01008579.1:168-1487(-)